MGEPSESDLAAWLGDKGRCIYCGVLLTVDNASKDHVIPKSKRVEGVEYINGTVPACRACNRDKNDYLPGEWLERMEMEVERLDKRRKILNRRIKRLRHLRRLPLFMRAWTPEARVDTPSSLSGTSKSSP